MIINFQNIFKQFNLAPVKLRNMSILSKHGIMLEDNSGVIIPRQHDYKIKSL